MSNNKNVLFLRKKFGNGQGTYIYPNGEKCVGDWKNGKYHGHGTPTWSDGHKYEGEWVNRREHGQGSLIFPYWSNYVGEFKDGNFWNGTTYEIDGNIFGK